MNPAVTRIDNHVDLALARLLYQYRILPERYSLDLPVTGKTIQTSVIGALLAAIVDQLQHVENELFAVDNGRMYFDGTGSPAEGAQLDGIGQLVGIERNGMTDTAYRMFITAKIAQNNSSGTIEEIIYLVRLLFRAAIIRMTESYPAEINFYLPNAQLDSSLYGIAQDMIRQSLPAGVMLGSITTTNASEVFAFCDKDAPSSVGGFGDAANTAPLYAETGGVFVSLI